MRSINVTRQSDHKGWTIIRWRIYAWKLIFNILNKMKWWHKDENIQWFWEYSWMFVCVCLGLKNNWKKTLKYAWGFIWNGSIIYFGLDSTNSNSISTYNISTSMIMDNGIRFLRYMREKEYKTFVHYQWQFDDSLRFKNLCYFRDYSNLIELYQVEFIKKSFYFMLHFMYCLWLT